VSWLGTAAIAICRIEETTSACKFTQIASAPAGGARVGGARARAIGGSPKIMDKRKQQDRASNRQGATMTVLAGQGLHDGAGRTRVA